MRVLLDTAVSTEGVGRALVGAGHNVGVLDHEPMLDALAHEDVLQLATKDGSILVTLNSGDYPRILRDWLASGRSHAGVILVHGIPPSAFAAIVAAIEPWFAEHPEQADWVDRAVIAEGTSGS